MRIEELKKGARYEFKPIVLSKEDIISFALQFDPLDFHTNEEAAKKSIFKGLVASGPHLFTVVHKLSWIPLFGPSVLAGVGVDKWKFLKPIYAGQLNYSHVEVIAYQVNPEKRSVLITWKYEFFNEKAELTQELEMTVVHKLQG